VRSTTLQLAAAVALYAALGLTLAWQGPGLQYDEALLVQGGVHLLNERTELPLPHDPDTFLCRGGRCVPLMTVRYVGAVKEYAGLPLFALFGANAFVVRLLSILLSMVVVYGVGRLMGLMVSPAHGAVAAFALALHPAFVDQSVFDNGTVAAPFFALGLLLVALARYGESSLAWRAFAIGACAGFGVWTRANFAWVLFALMAAMHVDLLRWLRARPRHALMLAAGGALGSLPFWIYQWISRGGTFAVFGLFPAAGTWREILLARSVMFAESLLSDREHRAIWGGGAIPAWQAWLMALVVLASLAVTARRYPRIAIAAAVLYALHFASSVQVAEHHFVTAVPFAVALVVASNVRCFAPLYLALALYWNGVAWWQLRETRGEGQWSNAIHDVHQAIADRYAGRTVNILDWGLQNNLFVLAGGRLKSREWIGEERDTPPLEAGGLFLTGGEANSFFPSGRGFAERLRGRDAACEEFHERRGALYARLCDVAPAGARRVESRNATGLHAREKDGWRWTAREFAFDVPHVHAAIDIHLPPAVFAAMKTVKLNNRTFRRPGDYRVPATVRNGRVAFTLDKALTPSAADGRELGVILRGVLAWP